MAIRQKVVECVPQSAEVRIQMLLRALQSITAQGLEEPTCAQIVVSLGTVQIPTESKNYMQFISDIKSVQEILEQQCSRQELKYMTLKTLYKEISDPNKQPSPAMSIVLQLIKNDHLPYAVYEILQSGYSENSLKNALFTLCNWLTKWTYTENLGPLVLAFMHGLVSEHLSIVIQAALYSIEQLFKLLIIPEPRKTVGPVVIYMLVGIKFQRQQLFSRILPHLSIVLKALNYEKSESSMTYSEEIINICIMFMKNYPTYQNIDELENILKPYLPLTNNYKQITLDWKTSIDGDNEMLTQIRTSIDKVGLSNLGNTCYMNSVLQALFMTKPFRNEILLNNKVFLPLFTKLQVLFALLQHSNKYSLSPVDILNLARPPGFLPGHQHDSSEFLGYLLDVLHEQEKSCNGIGSSSNNSEEIDENTLYENNSSEDHHQSLNNTIVQTAFGGRTVSISSCGLCGHKSERIDNFRELQLSFPNNSDNQSVQTLLDYYLQPEKLSGDNQYHCDICDCLTDGERVTFIDQAPPRLILTLKHFRYDPASQQRTKLEQNVMLDDNVQLVGGAKYELYAAVVHWGNSVDSGHYYTFAKDGFDWYKFNDCAVVKTTSEELRSLKKPETPYILFYARNNCADPENLPHSLLPHRLQLAVNKDNNESELEKRKPLKTYNTRHNRNDEPPPPGCGGGSFSNNSSNMYVC